MKSDNKISIWYRLGSIFCFLWDEFLIFNLKFCPPIVMCNFCVVYSVLNPYNYMLKLFTKKYNVKISVNVKGVTNFTQKNN